jgi:branched-chain amino acid transport system ATP-binding protein
MLEVINLTTGYGQVEILRGVSLSISKGEIVALLGANGVGKTTFNAAVSGLLKPWSGEILFEGQSLASGGTKAAIDVGIVLVPEGRHTFPNLTVRENLWLGGYRRGRANRARNLDYVLETFPRLRERMAQRAGTMSGGEQQMLAIGRGMMTEPRLLILDEPSLGLSPLLVEEMFQLIAQLNTEGLTILLVEQNVNLTLEIAHRGFVMENGVITVSGTAQELLDDPELQRSYMGL